ncbi:MAG: hypothetical protein HYV78_00275, partial [Candidatus Wildermuthbacteria bacterium]|nr:hypothetical protein [Candidatus Wildermuthbacteria bacterium]
TNLTPQNDYPVWQSTVTIGGRAVNFTRASFREIGSINYADLQNFRLYIDGVQVGSAIKDLDSGGYATFDLSAAPKKLETGARVFKLVADIIGGSSRNFLMSVRTASDLGFLDTQFGVNVLPTGTFPASAGTQTLSTGTVTITKTGDSPSGNVINSAAGALLAKYTITAAGEAVKIETLRVTFTGIDVDNSNNATTIGKLRNGALYANGVQIGSTADINEDSQSTAYTEYSLGSSLIVNPGSPVTLEVKADVYDSDATANSITANDTLQVNVAVGASNGFGQISGATINVPTGAQSANQVTVSTGGLTLSKYTAYTNQTLVPPATAAKIAHFTLAANTTEAINLNTISVDIDTVTDAFATATDLTNLYVKYGANETVKKATVATTGNSWSINYQLAAGQTVDVIVYADVATGATNGDGTADTGRVDMTVTGTTASSATSTTGGETTGQTITFGAGSFVAAAAGSTPVARIVAGNQTVTAASFEFTAASDSYTVKEVRAKVASAAVSAGIVNAILKDGSTVLGTKPFDTTSNTIAVFTGLNVAVPANTKKTLTVDLALSTPSADYSTSQINAKITLDFVKYANSQGVETSDQSPHETTSTSDTGTEAAGNNLFVYRSIPTATFVDTSNTTLVNGSPTNLYKFKVAADAKGDVSMKQVKLNIAWSDGGTADSLELESFKFFRGSQDITSLVTIQDQAGTSVESTDGVTEGDSAVVVTFDTEETVAAGTSQEYTVKATPQSFRMTGADTAGDSVTLSLVGDASANGTSVYLNAGTSTTTIAKLYTAGAANASATDHNFIWSDRSALSHVSAPGATSSADWANGNLVLNLDLDAETWTK